MAKELTNKRIYVLTEDSAWFEAIENVCWEKGLRATQFTKPGALMMRARDTSEPGAVIVDDTMAGGDEIAERTLNFFAGKSRNVGLEGGLQNLGVGLVVVGADMDATRLRKWGGEATQISARSLEKEPTLASYFAAARQAVDAAQKAAELAMLEKIGVKQQRSGRGKGEQR